MTRRRGTTIAGSPTLVGAVTTLIIIVAVFLAYNANQGLPFVPTYRVSAIVPNAARLVNANEVRIGGFRVGTIDSIEPVRDERTGRYVAKLNLKLDTDVKPLPQDTRVAVRYRSAFGLKYLALKPGKGAGLPEGATLPIAQADPRVEFDDVYSTFDPETRRNSRVNLVGFGDAFAARGQALNQAIENLNPLFRHLRPVMRNLSDPKTRLSRFFKELGDSARIVAPVAATQAELFTNMADTFAAFSADLEALKQTISKSPPTEDVAIRSFRVQRPFLADLADFSHRLRPGVAALPDTLPDLNDAFEAGVPAIKRTPPVNRELGRALGSLEELVAKPSTKVSLIRLADLTRDLKPGLELIVPAQTVCDYLSYWFTNTPEHFSAQDNYGFLQRAATISAPGGSAQEGSLASFGAAIQANGRGKPSREFNPDEFAVLHGEPYGPAVDKQGNADCQADQFSYPLGKLPVPGQAASTPAVIAANLPGNRGPSFHGRQKTPEKLGSPVR